MPRALLSVTDKTGIADFAQELRQRGFELISTGGTAKALREAGLAVKDVSEVTGYPERLDGRVKTLHPRVHGGILADLSLDSHRAQLAEDAIDAIDLVVVNLYQFEKTVTGEHTREQAIESIDIGGPTMIRAAAKNHAHVAVITDPGDYKDFLWAWDRDELAPMRVYLAAKAFRHTAYYDSVISRYLTQEPGRTPFTEAMTFGFKWVQDFRYGENPHQPGAWYMDPLATGGIARAKQLWGKEVSYNNLADADAAWELVCDLPRGACAIIKHANPCGAAVANDLGDSYRRARESDPISAFGGIAAFHGVVDELAAEAMTEKGNFLEVVIAEAFTPGALEIFKNRSGWGQDVRLLEASRSEKVGAVTIKTVGGGAIIQAVDVDPQNEWQVVTDLAPSEEQLAALRLQWAIVAHVKSNAIVVGTADRLLGIGAGQMNRVQSVRLALEQAGEKSKGAVLASDAFFPFPDSLQVASLAGISAVVQPGGSKKDPEVIAAGNELGIAMVFTGTRHFRH
jgi:phosphoribosylaminoimidazolecarboxamide formyltransferase / IMP cyclohydrolase